MPLPKAVEEQGRLAEELQQRMIDSRNTQGTPTEGQPNAPAPAPVQATPPAPAPAPAQTDAAAAPPPPAMVDAPSVNWEHKFRVLQGKYNAEVPRLKRANDELQDQLKAMQQQLQQLSEKVSAAPAPAPAPSISNEEVERYGPEFVEFVRKVARQEAPTQQVDLASIERSIASKVDERVRPAEEIGQRTAKQLFFADLTKLSPNWEQLNTDDKFLNWLADTDPLTGALRQDIFDDAYGKLDAQRVAAFFNSFGGAVSAAPTAPPLQTQVVPQTSGTPVGTPQPGKKIWYKSEVAKFYDDMRRGLVKPDEAVRIEGEIFAAQKEGRLR